MSSRCHLVVLTVIAVAALAIPAGSAFAAGPVVVTVDSAEPALVDAGGGEATVKVGLTNVTDGDVEVTPTAEACTLRPAVTRIPAATRSDITVAVGSECKALDTGFRFTLRARQAGSGAKGTSQDPFEIIAKAVKKPKKIDWELFDAFVMAFWVSLAGVTVIYFIAYFWTNGKAKPFTMLAGLEKSWSFKDSWLSNVTAISALVTAVVGSSGFLEAVLGDDAKATVGAATVAGLVALAITGAAGVVVLALKRPGAPGTMVAGFLLATVLAFTAAGGQVWTIAGLLQDIDLGFAHDNIDTVAWVVTGLLLIYASTSVLDLLKQGTHEEAKLPRSSAVATEVYAAAIVALATTGQGVTHDNVEELLCQLEPATVAAENAAKQPVSPTLPAAAYAPRSLLSERAALP